LLLHLRQLRLATLQLALRSRNGHAFSGAHAEQVDFEFGKGGKDVEEHLAHRIGRVMDLPAERERNTLGCKFVADRPGIGHGACEAIQLRHDQGVTVTNGCERLVEAGPFSVGSGESVVEVDPLGSDAECFKGVALSGEILFVDRAPCVSDQRACHHQNVTDSHPSLRNFSYQLSETSSCLVNDRHVTGARVSVWGS